MPGKRGKAPRAVQVNINIDRTQWAPSNEDENPYDMVSWKF